MTRIARILLPITLVLVACGGGGDPFADADPRCAAVCAIVVPELDGAFDVCDVESASACVGQCEARIADVETVCASCLLEGGYFGPGGIEGGGIECTPSDCTVEGRGGSCTYQLGDEAGEDECMREVYPRREVACEVEFESVASCAAVCGG